MVIYLFDKIIQGGKKPKQTKNTVLAQDFKKVFSPGGCVDKKM